MKHVVLGGGFAGVEAAIKLRKFGYDVTLVSDRDYLFIYPISIWIPIGNIAFDDAKLPLSQLKDIHGFKLVIDAVMGIEPEKNNIVLKNGNLHYDYLFIAMGMHKVMAKGVENTLTICGNPIESLKIKEELSKVIANGKGRISVGFGGNPNDESASAVRGGPAFELIFNISTHLKKVGIRNNFELNFFAPMKEPGKKMGNKALKNMGSFFTRYKVNTHFGKKIIEFTKQGVVFEDNTLLNSDLTIFISGGAGHAVIANSGLPVNAAGFIKTNGGCKVDGFENVYAIGDAAQLLGPEWAAKQGHMAEIMADVSVHNVHCAITGTGTPQSYIEKVSIICVMDSGDGAAMISRTQKGEKFVMLPIVGHWMKKAWGIYYRNSKLKNIPRIPGM